MKIENKKIVECTEDELYEHYLKIGLDDLYSFTDFMQRCEENRTKVIPKGYVEVVRCKDCKYYLADDEINTLKFCELSDRPRDEDFYCKFGKRKDGTE